MNKTALLDYIGVLRLAAVALAITAALGMIACWLAARLVPVVSLGAAMAFPPWIAGGVLGALWMTLLRAMVRRSRFLSTPS